MRHLLALSFSLVPLVLAGCDDEGETVAEEVIRAVKTVTVAQEAAGQVREFAGTVVAADVSALSF